MPMVTPNMVEGPAPERSSRRRAPRPSLPSLPRLPRNFPGASRWMLGAALVVAAALAPEPWLRGFLLGVALATIYLAGYWDGRRDLARDIVRERLGAARPPAPAGAGEDEPFQAAP